MANRYRIRWVSNAVFSVYPQTDQELATIGRTGEMPALPGCSLCEKSWHQIELTLKETIACKSLTLSPTA